jgi:hypothetical protein
MEKVVQLLDEVDEVVGLIVLGVRANASRIALSGCLFALALIAILLPL